MSRPLYVGPFGRLLPVPENEPPGDRNTSRDSPSLPMPHSTYQLPPPRIPGPLQSGTDPFPLGQQIPNRRDYTVSMHNVKELGRPIYSEQLPPVSQLLTPASHSSVPASPYSPQHHSNSPPVVRSVHASPLGEQFERPPQPQLFHGHGFATPPIPFSSHEGFARSYSQQSTPRMDSLPPPSQARTAFGTSEQREWQSLNSALPVESQISQYHQGQLPYPSTSQHGTSSPAPSQSGLHRSVHMDGQAERKPSTGQRIPRVIEERHVPGEGICYFYEDGSRCKKVIDGEVVNASWGVTKAGKPRKRLAQACMTCREKKIKCDPNYPKCVQCQKFGRECRFENAPRGNQTTVASPPYSSHPSRSVPIGDPSLIPPIQLSEVPYSQPKASKPRNADSALKRSTGDLDRLVSLPSPAENPQEVERPNKRRRQESISYPDSNGESTRRGKGKSRSSDSPLLPTGIPELEMAEALGTVTDWKTDPYEVYPESTVHYMDMYFTHINAATYCMFPRKPFMHWVETCREKTPDDRMIIYSLLAMGSIFSPKAERKSHGKHFGNIARYATEKSHGKFSLQLVQSRLILALLHFSLGDSMKAWDFCGSALRVACGLKLNLEEGILDIKDDQILDYGLTKEGLVECHRRTFWSAYVMDRFNGFCSGHLSIIHDQDIFARLPCKEDIYENQQGAITPYFHNAVIDRTLSRQANPSALGPMAFLAEISSLWGSVLANVYRSAHRDPGRYQLEFEQFYAKMQAQLDVWMSSLPSHLTYTPSNMDESIKAGYIGTFISLHTLYHTTSMKLNRHVRHEHLSSTSINRNICSAHHHARELLQIARVLAKVDRQRRIPDLVFAFSTPFTGYAILTAVDILSASGPMAELPGYLSLIDSGLEVVEELAGFWSSARCQLRAITHRLQDLAKAAYEQPGDKLAFATSAPIETTFGLEDDLIYSVGREKYFQALGLGEISEMKGNILRVQATGHSSEYL